MFEIFQKRTEEFVKDSWTILKDICYVTREAKTCELSKNPYRMSSNNACSECSQHPFRYLERIYYESQKKYAANQPYQCVKDLPRNLSRSSKVYLQDFEWHPLGISTQLCKAYTNEGAINSWQLHILKCPVKSRVTVLVSSFYNLSTFLILFQRIWKQNSEKKHCYCLHGLQISVWWFTERYTSLT